jgi:fatty acid desaturase
MQQGDLLHGFAPDARDDYSNAFARIRSSVRNACGVRLAEFVRSLKPDYRRVHLDIFAGYAAVTFGLAAAAVAESWGVPRLLVVPPSAIWLGYWVAYLHLFLHEGAHWGLAGDRASSDRICNLCIGWLVLIDVRDYRVVHFQHHRALGTVEDSEISYFFSVDLVFVMKGLFGIRALERWLSYRRDSARPQHGRSRTVAAAGAAAHLLLIAGLLVLGLVAAACAWVVALGCVFPLLATLRQALEHRHEEARPDVNYAAVNHGAFTRLFGNGWLARTFGGAGFNRHLLHHWEPQVSYTRLPDLERFLAGTPVATIMDRRRTSYGEAFRRLFSLY